jgi:hypothetical protein
MKLWVRVEYSAIIDRVAPANKKKDCGGVAIRDGGSLGL